MAWISGGASPIEMIKADVSGSYFPLTAYPRGPQRVGLLSSKYQNDIECVQNMISTKSCKNWYKCYMDLQIFNKNIGYDTANCSLRIPLNRPTQGKSAAHPLASNLRAKMWVIWRWDVSIHYDFTNDVNWWPFYNLLREMFASIYLSFILPLLKFLRTTKVCQSKREIETTSIKTNEYIWRLWS